MQEIIVETQAQWNALPKKFESEVRVVVRGGSAWARIVISKVPENAHVEAKGSSHVVARESSHVVAWGSSHVEAWGSSHVEAWESSHVVAWGQVSVHMQSDAATALLFAFAVCIAVVKGKIQKKSKTATVVSPKWPKGVPGWLARNGVEEKAKITVYKRVSKDFLTQENTERETKWAVGSTVEHSAWDPTKEECGGGKFHACSQAYFCDEFRSAIGDRYVAIEVLKKDLYAWENPQYPTKIAFRKGTVAYECDRYGKRIEQKAVAA